MSRFLIFVVRFVVVPVFFFILGLLFGLNYHDKLPLYAPIFGDTKIDTTWIEVPKPSTYSVGNLSSSEILRRDTVIIYDTRNVTTLIVDTIFVEKPISETENLEQQEFINSLLDSMDYFRGQLNDLGIDRRHSIDTVLSNKDTLKLHFWEISHRYAMQYNHSPYNMMYQKQTTYLPFYQRTPLAQLAHENKPKKDSWYESKWFYFVTGFATGVVGDRIIITFTHRPRGY